jgi:hypothetical protein
MKKRFLIPAVFFAFMAFRSDGWQTLHCIKVKSAFFTTDNIGNIYTVNGDQISKFSPNGDLLKIYSNKKLGKISSVDASNPLRIVVYYKDFARVVLLDSQLSENGEGISLETLNLEQSDLHSITDYGCSTDKMPSLCALMKT